MESWATALSVVDRIDAICDAGAVATKAIYLCSLLSFKHALADRVRISLTRENGEILLLVSDNGSGFDTKEVRQKPGLGLVSMRERLRLVDGTFAINSRPGKGCEINARIRYN